MRLMQLVKNDGVEVMRGPQGQAFQAIVVSVTNI